MSMPSFRGASVSVSFVMRQHGDEVNADVVFEAINLGFDCWSQDSECIGLFIGLAHHQCAGGLVV